MLSFRINKLSRKITKKKHHTGISLTLHGANRNYVRTGLNKEAAASIPKLRCFFC